MQKRTTILSLGCWDRGPDIFSTKKKWVEICRWRPEQRPVTNFTRFRYDNMVTFSAINNRGSLWYQLKRQIPCKRNGRPGNQDGHFVY